MKFGARDMVSPLRSVLVRRPEKDFSVEAPEVWNYMGVPDLKRAQEEHAQFVEVLKSEGVEVHFHEERLSGFADSIFVFDPSLITDEGVVVLRMGKDLRQGEEEALAATHERLGIPSIGSLTGNARAEGGDLLRLDERTLLAGVGFRTNQEGVRQLSRILSSQGIEVIPLDLPYWKGPGACLHLLSLISMVDRNRAVVYPPLMPVRFWELLQERNIDLIEVGDDEFLSMATNILTIRPGVCLMLEGNDKTKEELESRGYEVLTYRGRELSLKAEGGPTCLTLPLLRESG